MLPALYYMFEVEQFRSNYVTEVCRPSHLGSIVWGLVFGLALKRVV